MSESLPLWFVLSENLTSAVMSRIANTVRDIELPNQTRSAPMLAHWFLLDTLLIANRANRDGMHANALVLMRQCVEALSVVELGVCKHPDASETLGKWDAGNMKAGEVRRWLERYVWPDYGTGLFSETWATLMREFASSLQEFAHYGPKTAQWQTRLLMAAPETSKDLGEALIEMAPRAYDPQKATRITLFHAIIVYILGRVWVAANPGDEEFHTSIGRFGVALGKSRYLDGHSTNWGSQFYAMMWGRNGEIVLE